ncbi:WD40 repeat-like protein [Suillus brevipes Sb2]|nr:WD40 repeat-like protein [Suillus brevipes Sb2]
MSSQTSKKQETTAEVTPIKTRGHTGQVGGVVHLPGGQQIITCSRDGSLRLWDLESGTQIGEDWRDDEAKEAGVNSIALSPDGKTVVSGNNDGKMRLWDIETGIIVAKWGHTYRVTSVCWSAGGDRVVSGSSDGTARIWNAKTGEEILEIKTGYVYVWAVKYSPDSTQIATGGYGSGDEALIWDAKTGKLTKSLAEFQHDQYRYWHSVSSLAWTSDGKNLITASHQEIKIFDTTPWRLIATLKGHKEYVSDAITLSRNNLLLASVSDDQTARIWNLDTNLPVGQLKDWLYSTTFSANGRVLVTGSSEGNMYTWDVHAILHQAGLEDPLTDANIASQDERTPRSSLSDQSFLNADATRGHDEFGGFDELLPRFFDGMEVNDDSSPTGGAAHPHSSSSAFLARLASLLHRFRPDNSEANEPSQHPTLLGMHPRVLFARLSSLIHRSPAENDAPNELQQPSTPSRLDLVHAILTSLSSHFPRSQLNTEDTEPHTATSSRSHPNTLMGLLSSRFRSQHHTNEDIELSQRAIRPHVVEVAPMRDREVLFVADRAQANHPHPQSANTAAPGARPVYSRPIRLLGHIGLFLCCVCDHQHTDDSAQPTQQQQGQSQGPVSTQVSSLQTTTAAVSTSTTPTVPTTTPAAATP